MSVRVALYWAPDPADKLHEAGSAWLGRDAERGAPVPQPPIPGLAEITAAPRIYGLHATLRPPMRLSTDWPAFLQAADHVAATVTPFDLPPLAVADMAGFLALRESAPCPALHALADACVVATDPHRLHAGAAELGHRRKPGLSARQDEMLVRWGYPHVMQDWRFHVTLSRRLDTATMARLRAAAEAHFAAALAVPRRVGSIAVFTQLDGGDFLVAERIALRG